MLFDLDSDRILSDSQQWLELSWKWGEPIDLEDKKEISQPVRNSPGSIQDLNRTTFDSCKFIKSLKRTEPSQHIPNYNEFANGIQEYKLIFQEDSTSHWGSQFFNMDGLALSSASSTMRHSPRQEQVSVPILLQGKASDCEIDPLCNEFSKVVERVSRDLVYLERYGKRRSRRRNISRGDVRRVKWNRMSVAV